MFLVVVVGMFGYLILKDSDSGSPGGVVYISNSQDSGTTTEPVTPIDTGLTDPTDTGLSGNSTDSTEITESPTNSTEAEPTEINEEPVPEAPVDEFKGQIEFGKPSAEFGFWFPSEEELVDFHSADFSMADPGWRIKRINYKANRDKFSLSLIQFVFANGAVAPECSAAEASDGGTLVSVDVDPSKVITGV